MKIKSRFQRRAFNIAIAIDIDNLFYLIVPQFSKAKRQVNHDHNLVYVQFGIFGAFRVLVLLEFKSLIPLHEFISNTIFFNL